ncbi:MAG: hypothetical protein IJO19_04295, partial [Clostridia bacterium]|nr:hypothetical protein [Clostridia bacterium]
YDDLISTDSLEESLCELTDDEETQNLIKDNLSDYKKLQILTLNYNSIETNLSTIKTNLEKLNFKYLNKELLSLNKNNLFKNSNSVSKIKKLLEKELSSVLKTLENYNNYFNAIQNSMEELNKNIDLVSSYTKNNLSTLKYYLNNNLNEEKEKKKNDKQFDFLWKLRDYKNKTKMSTTQLANMQNYYYLFSDEYGYIQATGKTKNKFISSQLEISDNNAQFISEFIISSVIVDKKNADTDKDNILSTNEKNTAIDNINISTKNKSIIKTIYDLGTSQVDSDDDGLKDCSFDSASVSDRKRIILDYNNHKEKKQ